MRKVIAAFNMTLDGICDHTAVTAGEEIHQYYSQMLSAADTVLYGRITYQLMEYWKGVAENPTGNKAIDDFAATMDNMPDKVVFSHTLKSVNWKNARVANRDVREEVIALKQRPGKDILIGSRSIIIEALKLDLVDEFRLCVHPVIAGNGLALFPDIMDRIELRLLETQTFQSGAVAFRYAPIRE